MLHISLEPSVNGAIFRVFTLAPTIVENLRVRNRAKSRCLGKRNATTRVFRPRNARRCKRSSWRAKFVSSSRRLRLAWGWIKRMCAPSFITICRRVFESYVQEIGRAGRDGLPSHCHVFVDPEVGSYYFGFLGDLKNNHRRNVELKSH